ncbi:MAG: peptide deformylase [Candidatus Liptonbacteria bacterium]|nr:peptide deformylase [Candidatus Liptonbacteria bacterium]
MANNIITIENKKDEKFLRRKTEDFDFEKFSRKEIFELISKMRAAMRAAHGIGLSANQIGLTYKMFVAEVPAQNGGTKFYSVFNPKIEKTGTEKVPFEEGCLSVPLTYGTVERPERITVVGQDKGSKHIKIKAWGLLARVFQHEIDHLEGRLFIDKAKNIQRVESRIKKHE